MASSTKNSASGLDLSGFAQAFSDQTRAFRWKAVKLAYSGGIDSQVLLQLLVELRNESSLDIQAIHINHGMHPQAEEWERFCRAQCEQLGVEYVSCKVAVDRAVGGPEAAARSARYRALATFVSHGDVLLTAHHGDDQAETLLLQLMRGSGTSGLASMPLVSGFSDGHHFRPLLGFNRKQIQRYANTHKLAWVEDPSNLDVGVRRSFIRHQLMPMLKQQWPQAARLIGRSAGHIAEADSLLAELAELDRVHCAGRTDRELSITTLSALSPHRLRNLLRFWIREQGWTPPSSQQLAQITSQIYEPSITAHAMVRWGRAACYRYRDRLWLQMWMPHPLTSLSYNWDLSGPLEMPGAGIELVAHAVQGEGLAQSRLKGAVNVGFRVGGEKCQLHRQRHRMTLKNLFQQAGIPPWERDRTPLIYVDGELAAVGDRWVCEPFAATENEAGWRLEISPISQK